MELKNLKDAEKRVIYVARIRKKLFERFRGRSKNTNPLFIAGWQRSGTTMMMNIFHHHPDIEVFDESQNSEVFCDFRVRNVEIIKKTLQKSCFPFACYKVICDSHIIKSFIDNFSDAKIIWMYRNATDNAESNIKKFPNAATQAIRRVSQGEEPRGCWFTEGVTSNITTKLKEVTSSEYLTEFDFACLAWWGRNSLFFELGLEQIPNVRLLEYEKLVQEPKEVMEKLFCWSGPQWDEKIIRFVHDRSVKKKDLPNLNRKVERLCEDLKDKLRREFIKSWPSP